MVSGVFEISYILICKWLILLYIAIKNIPHEIMVIVGEIEIKIHIMVKIEAEIWQHYSKLQ